MEDINIVEFWNNNFPEDYVNKEIFIKKFSKFDVDKLKLQKFVDLICDNNKVSLENLTRYIEFVFFRDTVEELIDGIYILDQILSYPGYIKINHKLKLKNNEYIIKPNNNFFELICGNKTFLISYNYKTREYIIDKYKNKVFTVLMSEFLYHNNHPEPYFKSLNYENIKLELNIKKKFLDFTIILNNGKIKTNKYLLYCCSKYFETLFDLHPEIDEIQINDDIENFNLIIDFLYDHEIFHKLELQQQYDLILLLKKYNFNINHEFLVKNLDISNEENFGELVNELLDNGINPDVIADKISENTNIKDIYKKYLKEIAKSKYLNIKDFTIDNETIKIINSFNDKY